MPNVVAIAADRDGVIYGAPPGPRAAGGSDPISADTHFRIMSMTKMVATVAALQLVETGRLDLDAPIDTYRPEFADVQVLDGFDGDTPRLRAPASRATVKQLVTHTTGLGYWFFDEELAKWEAVTSTPNVLSGSNVIFTAPLLADPGTTYVYGINTDWLGKVVEAAGGVGLDVAIKDGITGPLGMDETAFRIAEGWKEATHPRAHQGRRRRWVDSGIELNQSPEYYAGGHGLYSTPHDYIRFERALLRGGELDGVRILSADTVDAAFTNQIGDLDFPPAIPTADPSAPPTSSTPGRLEVGLRAAAQHRGPARACGARAAARGPGCATRTSGSTAPAASARRSTPTSCRSSRRRRCALHQLRAGALRRAVSPAAPPGILDRVAVERQDCAVRRPHVTGGDPMRLATIRTAAGHRAVRMDDRARQWRPATRTSGRCSTHPDWAGAAAAAAGPSHALDTWTTRRSCRPPRRSSASG